MDNRYQIDGRYLKIFSAYPGSFWHRFTGTVIVDTIQRSARYDTILAEKLSEFNATMMYGSQYHLITFDTEEDLTFFILRWS
jgi:hypothetical protein